MTPDPDPAAELADLSRAVRRLSPPSRLDPERFHLERDEISVRLARLARNGGVFPNGSDNRVPRKVPVSTGTSAPRVVIRERVRVVVVRIPARLLHPPRRARLPMPPRLPAQGRLGFE